MKLGDQWRGKKHKPGSNLKRSETMKKLYASGVKMGFRSKNGYKAIWLSPHDYWKGKKLPFDVWNKGKKGLQISWRKGKKFPDKSGVNSPSWKGGVTPLRIKIQGTDEWKNWIKLVMRRDSFKCVNCGENNNHLHVDHIIPYSVIREKNNIQNVEDALKCEELWDINNGRVLCIDCHKETDTYLSKSWKAIKALKCSTLINKK